MRYPKLLPLMHYTEMEREIHRRNRSRCNISPAIIYFGGALLVYLLMGYGFGFPDLSGSTVDVVPCHEPTGATPSNPVP